MAIAYRNLLALLVLLCLVSYGIADFASDSAECTDQLMGLATCLTYVQDAAKTPTPDCCNGLKKVLAKSAKCLCVLVKDRNDPGFGMKIDADRALDLPLVCNVPANISNCPKLLNLRPNSKDAEIFKKSGNAAIGSPSTSDKGNVDNATNPHVSGCGKSVFLGGRIRWFGIEMAAYGFCFFLIILIPLYF